jgi:mono/diheme cytochrome c family protein
MTMKRTVMTVAILLGTAMTAYAQMASRSVWDGVFTADQAVAGKALYDGKCAACHGATLGGNEMAPALAGGGFMSNWSGQSVGDLAGRIHSTMPANAPGTLSNRQTAAIVAYLLSANQFPAGQNMLPPEPMLLQQIFVTDQKPGTK